MGVKNSLQAVWVLILGWLFFMVLLVFFIQAKGLFNVNPLVRARQEVMEAFQTQEKVSDVPDINLGGMSPGDPELNTPRQPYALLNGWLPLADDPKYLTAQGCHESDFQIRLERTGNFRQLTNNYKRGDPDSCSAPIQDLGLAVYKTAPIPNTGCIGDVSA